MRTLLKFFIFYLILYSCACNEEEESKSYYTVGNVLIGTGIIVTAVGLSPLLCGFGSAGIVAGSAAASIQAAVGNVAAGSLFASMTSMGMTGTFTTIAVAGVTTTGVGVAAKTQEK